MATTAPRWLDQHEQAIWRGYLKMTNLLSAHLNRSLVTKSGMSDGDYGVLVSLSEAEGTRLRAFELARQLQWEKSRLSHQLTRMQGRGLIKREDCPSDARGAFVVLTDAGREAIDAAAPRHVEDVRRYFFDLLTPQQLATLDEIATAVVGNIEPECPSIAAGDAGTAGTDGCDEAAGCDE